MNKKNFPCYKTPAEERRRGDWRAWQHLPRSQSLPHSLCYFCRESVTKTIISSINHINQNTFMLKILLFVFLTPLFGYCQNIITTVGIYREIDTSMFTESEYINYSLKISPGYHDRLFKLELIKKDSLKNETILSQPEINVNLIVHKKEYKITGSNKYEWDYSTEVKSNDTYTDEYLTVPDCSNTRNLNCLLRLKKIENYKIKIYNSEKIIFEKELDSD